MVVDPCAVQDRVPIWIGGRTLRSLRRAATLADGWAPFNVSLHQARDWLSRFDFGPDSRSFCRPRHALDPISEPERTRDPRRDPPRTAPPSSAPSSRHTSLQHYLENLQALAELHSPAGGAA